MAELPKEPGYYWRRGPNHNDEVVEQVVEVGPMVSSIPNELFYWEPGRLGGVFIQHEPNVEWSEKLVWA